MLRLDEFGLLPDGVHDCSMEDIEQTFGRFRGSEARVILFARLKHYFEDLQKWRPGAVMIVDGSFVMGCVEAPGDVDLLVVLPPAWDLEAELCPVEYNLLSKRRTKAAYGFDVIVAPADTQAEQEWKEFFRQVNPKWRQEINPQLPATKGILKVVTP